MRIGYFLSSEEFDPRALVRQAEMAEQAGFEGLWISDHFHPWNDAQGHSGFVWSTIGAISKAVASMKVTVAVTCPTMRMHPALVAHAAATSAVLLDGRFALGVGSGEALNEQLPGELSQILPTPAHFEQACELVSEQMVAEAIPCGPDLSEHRRAIERYADAGFDELYIGQIGPEQEAFFDVYAREILPRFADGVEARGQVLASER